MERRSVYKKRRRRENFGRQASKKARTVYEKRKKIYYRKAAADGKKLCFQTAKSIWNNERLFNNCFTGIFCSMDKKEKAV